jgi:hypothetical protein
LSTDTVLDVQTAISSSDSPSSPLFDVALVFDAEDPDRLVGLFTESDYIQVREVIQKRNQEFYLV